MSQVRTRKRGKTFSYIFEAGKKPDGKRKVVEKGGFESKKAAYDAGVAAYNDWRHGNIGIVSENITLKDFITNWLEKVVAPNVKPTTLQTYYDFTQYQIVPYIGNLMLQKSRIVESRIFKKYNSPCKNICPPSIKLCSLSCRTPFIQSGELYKSSKKSSDKCCTASYHFTGKTFRTA